MDCNGCIHKKICALLGNAEGQNAFCYDENCKETLKDIIGADYDLDRLRELVEADRGGRCVIIKKCYECKHHLIAYGYNYCRFWHKCCPNDGDFYCQYAMKGEK